MDKDWLMKLISEDDDDLLYVRPISQHQSTNDRLILKFQEINEFIRDNKREPRLDSEEIHEFSLGNRLDSFRQNNDHIRLLKKYDDYKVLETNKAPATVEDILTSDDFDLLGTESDDIFKLTHIPTRPESPDYIAQRKVCQNFEEFESLFTRCQADLAAGKRRLIPFANEQQIEKGDFFILRGVLTYILAVGEKELKNGKTNARLHCVFENETESDMLLRSLARELYKDGQRVTVHEDRLIDELRGKEESDKETGYIYVLKSLSQHGDIQKIEHLYKIGFSRIPVEERIKNAAQDPTFLMAPVSVIASYQCYNLNPQKLENFLHRFFGNSCLDLDIFDQNNKKLSPREWFIAPLEVIDRVIHLLISGKITNYQYDPVQGQLVARDF